MTISTTDAPGCSWCQPGCPSCTSDRDCECYTHQDEPDRHAPAEELNKADSLLIHGHEFLLLPLVAVVLGLVLALSAAPAAEASKWQGWAAWCNQHPTSPLPVCLKVTR